MTHPYTVVRSKRRTLALEITAEAQIIVRAPLRASSRDIEHLLSSHDAWIETHLLKQQQRLAQRPPLTDDDMSELKARAKQLLPGRVEYYASLMKLFPTGISITGAKKRFGSCSPKNRLCFSYHLMRYPDEAIDYVVVHELAHILHKNHGKAFYALIESILPDYKARQKLLKS